MLRAVGLQQRNDLLKLFQKYPEMILCELSSLCRLEYLKVVNNIGPNESTGQGKQLLFLFRC